MDAKATSTMRSASLDGITKQDIKLVGKDDCNSFAVYGQEVNVELSVIDERFRSSNKVTISPVVTFDWAVKHYPGALVALDQNDSYVAYALKGRSGGIVRVIHVKRAERALIKGYEGLVVDLTFMHSQTRQVLASLDETGSLFVHEIFLDDGQHVATTVLLHLNWNCPPEWSKRVIWCKYLPDETEDSDELSRHMMLATIMDKAVYILNAKQLVEEHGSGPHVFGDVSNAVMEISVHRQSVIDAAFSPDGTALATASQDGIVRFFQVDMNRPSSPRCIHQWAPHDGEPLSMINFLDNYKTPSVAEQFWKFALTGANHNLELKIWACDKWVCLQTLRFVSPSPALSPFLVASTDLSSNYLVMSDIRSRVMYVLKIHHGAHLTTAHFSSVSEFILGSPCLSFAIRDVQNKAIRGEDEEEEPQSGENEAKLGISVNLYAVQPRNLQDFQINFVPEMSTGSLSKSAAVSSSYGGRDLYDGLSDVSMMSPAISVAASSQSNVLLTPDTFTSMSSPLGLRVSSPLDSQRSSFTQVTHTVADSSSMLTVAGADSSSVLTLAGAAFAGDSVSTISSVTLTPKSSISVHEPSQTTHWEVRSIGVVRLATPSVSLVTPSLPSHMIHGTQDTENSAGKITPPSSALQPSDMQSEQIPPEQGSRTPLVQEDRTSLLQEDITSLLLESRTAPGNRSPLSEQTSRQLEEIFGSLVGSGVSSVSTDPALTMCLPSELLTEEDILKQAEEAMQHADLLPKPLSANYDTNAWPRAPDVPVQPPSPVDTDNSDTTESDSDSECSSSGRSSEGLNVKEIEQDVQIEDGSQSQVPLPLTSQRDGAEFMHDKFTEQINVLEEVRSVLGSLTRLVEHQARDIEALQVKLTSLDDVHMVLRDLQRTSLAQSSTMDSSLANLAKDSKLAQDRLISTATQKLTMELKHTVEKTLAAELKKSVVPGLQQLVDPVKKELHGVMVEKLTAADAAFKDNVQKMASSQVMVDRISHSVGVAVQSVVQACYRDTMQQLVLPSFDASTREMFKQISSHFQVGTNDYLKQLGDHMTKVKAKLMNVQEVITGQCETGVEALKRCSIDVQAHLAASIENQLATQVKQAVQSIQPQLIHEIRKVVKEEVTQAMDIHQKTLSSQLGALSRSAPSTSGTDSERVKVQIDHLVVTRDFNEAFQKALCGADLSLVEYLVRKASAHEAAIFAEPCLLSQPTLLSLVQQLSCGLREPDLDMKLRFMSDALLKIDTTDPEAGRHITGVILAVRDKFTEFSQRNPASTLKPFISAIDMSIKTLLRYARK